MADLSQSRESGHTGKETDPPAGALKPITEGFAARFAEAAGRVLGTRVTVRFSCLVPLPRQEFRDRIASLACSFAYGPTGAGADTAARVWLGLDAAGAGAVLDVLLGGSSGAEDTRPAKPTAIEGRVLGRVMDMAAEALADIWPPLGALRRLENPGRPECEMTSLVRFDLGIGGARGVLAAFIAGTILADASDRMTGPIELSATFDAGTIGEDELSALGAGDVIVGDAKVDGEVTVRLAGIPKFAGQLSIADGRKAVTLKRKLTSPKEDAPAEPADDARCDD